MGEDKLIVMLGGLHIQLAVLKAVGSWLLGSGWTEAVAQARITTTGRAESLVTSDHITRTRYVHHVTASSLYILKQRAYKNYYEECAENALLFPEGCKDKASKIPQFQFWNMTLKFELTYSHSRALLSTIGPQTIYCCFDGNYPFDVRSRPH